MILECHSISPIEYFFSGYWRPYFMHYCSERDGFEVDFCVGNTDRTHK